ncbi:MAG TPA: adenylate/guanylate cyclase domain-containing protein [Candidatus Nanoarchaeia archaeon]|nr:adenylate/guanylate cyclase domain-containing protein [Candidatus Nanoarchaeia archaeon]
MYKLLTKEERERIEKINSKLHGAEYLSNDLRNILYELKELLRIENSIIFLKDNGKDKKEFIGDAKDLWTKYEESIKKYIEKANLMKHYVLAVNLNEDIKRLLIIPIHEKEKIIGSIIILNKKINYEKDEHSTEIIKILQNQIKFSLKKSKEREELINLFGKYIDKRQIAKMLENPEFLRKPEMIDSVVLIADLSGFTRLSNEKSVEDVFNFLSKVLYEYTKIINVNNGIVDKFVGDQIIGIFGIIDFNNRLENSIKSAVELQKILKNEFMKKGIGVKISITTGKVLYGNLGGNYKADLTVIGPPVNLASRLNEYASRGEILTDSNIYNKLKNKYRFKLKSFTKFEGFKIRMMIYKLVY